MCPEDLYEAIHLADSLGVDHISLYSLILEEGTPLFKEYETLGLSLMSEDQEREVFHKALEMLKEKGYGRYEVSNFAKEGCQCKHNLLYWTVEDYIGLGVSAHGKYAFTRYHNTASIGEYRDLIGKGQFPIEEKEVLSLEDEAFEAIMLGLHSIVNSSTAEKSINSLKPFNKGSNKEGGTLEGVPPPINSVLIFLFLKTSLYNTSS
jgi:oxygen-independent coproporphyrinogen-3 oxidase